MSALPNTPQKNLTLVFDLDGTLADTNQDLIPTLNRVLSPLGFDPVTPADMGHIVGHGAKAMLKKAFQLRNCPVSEDELQPLFDQFITDYEANIAQNTPLYDGVLTVLEGFASRGAILSICTNKMHHLATKLINELGLSNMFASIVGGDYLDVRKPDPAHLLAAIEMAGGTPTRSVMIGDSNNDILTARNANIPVVCVDFGYSDRPIREYLPDQVISHYHQLPDAVEKLISEG